MCFAKIHWWFRSWSVWCNDHDQSWSRSNHFTTTNHSTFIQHRSSFVFYSISSCSDWSVDLVIRCSTLAKPIVSIVIQWISIAMETWVCLTSNLVRFIRHRIKPCTSKQLIQSRSTTISSTTSCTIIHLSSSHSIRFDSTRLTWGCLINTIYSLQSVDFLINPIHRIDLIEKFSVVSSTTLFTVVVLLMSV